MFFSYGRSDAHKYGSSVTIFWLNKIKWLFYDASLIARDLLMKNLNNVYLSAGSI